MLVISCGEIRETLSDQTIRRVSFWPESPSFTLWWFIHKAVLLAGVLLIWLGFIGREHMLLGQSAHRRQ